LEEFFTFVQQIRAEVLSIDGFFWDCGIFENQSRISVRVFSKIDFEVVGRLV
jgi:hypothetical protein